MAREIRARRERALEVTERAIPPDGTYLPPELVDHFSAQGYVVTMASRFPEEVGRLAGYGRHPVALLDLPEAMQANGGLALRQAGVWISPEGLLFKGDCYVYIQSEDSRDQQLQEGMNMWMQQDRASLMEDEAQELSNKIAAMNGGNADIGRVTVQNGGRLSDFVGRA
jgi:hypothetical protein